MTAGALNTQHEELSDKHISATIIIIAAQFPGMPRVQSSLHARKISLLRPAKNNTLFFHNFSGHWVLSHYKDGTVSLYDSLQPSYLHCELKQQMAALYKGVPVVRLQPSQVQKGFKDCGCFVCTSLLFGDDPSMLIYNQSEMRKHVIGCFERRYLTPFPAKPRKSKRKTAPVQFRIY